MFAALMLVQWVFALIIAVTFSPYTWAGEMRSIHVHVYAALWVRGSVRAMTQGYVTPGWAWRHHRAWLRRLAASGSEGPRPRFSTGRQRQ